MYGIMEQTDPRRDEAFPGDMIRLVLSLLRESKGPLMLWEISQDN